MAKEWFRLAEDVDRLKGRHLNPVKDKLANLNFERIPAAVVPRNKRGFALGQSDVESFIRKVDGLK